MKYPCALTGLTEACAFRPFPRGPVRFREVSSSAPFHLSSPRPSPPPAPRRPAFKHISIRPPSPPRFMPLRSASASKSGVTQTPLNRFIARPSRIPVPVRNLASNEAQAEKRAPSAPGPERSNVEVHAKRRKARENRNQPWRQTARPTMHTTADSDTENSVCLPPLPCPPVRPRVGDKAAASTERARASPLKGILAKSSEEAKAKPKKRVHFSPVPVKPSDEAKEKPEKRVRFSDSVRVHNVSFWIDRKKHVFDNGLRLLGRLQGWRVTPLEKPDEDGETEHYMTIWGHDHSNLHYHRGVVQCPQPGCVWSRIARFEARLAASGVRLPESADVVRAWSVGREKIRQRGGWRL